MMFTLSRTSTFPDNTDHDTPTSTHSLMMPNCRCWLVFEELEARTWQDQHEVQNGFAARRKPSFHRPPETCGGVSSGVVRL